MGSIMTADQTDGPVMTSGTVHCILRRLYSSFRKIEVEQDVIQTTNGSSRVRIGATEILVGVKAELEKPEIATPKEGKRMLKIYQRFC